MELQNNCININPKLKLISTSQDTILINRILTENEKLIFAFSKFTCHSCIENEISNIKKFESKFGSTNIILITDNENIRDLIMFCKFNNISWPIYKVEEGLFNLHFDQIHLPYYFILNNKCNIKDLFIIDNNFIPEASVDYLKIVSKKYFTSMN